MNTKKAKSNWADTKAKIKTQFGKLTDASIDSLNESLEALPGKIQSAYGYAKEQAEKEVAKFKESLHEATAPKKESKKESAGVSNAKKAKSCSDAKNVA